MAVVCFPLGSMTSPTMGGWVACVTPSSVMKVSPQGEGLQVMSISIPPCPVLGMYGVFSNRDSLLNSGRQPFGNLLTTLINTLNGGSHAWYWGLLDSLLHFRVVTTSSGITLF